jgi:hypothetical protein
LDPFSFLPKVMLGAMTKHEIGEAPNLKAWAAVNRRV